MNTPSVSDKLALAGRLVPLLAFLLAVAAQGAEPVKVFVLAGQSNMEGKAQVALLERQIDAPATRERFAHLHREGKWIEREDVWIKFLDRKGKLTVGYGSPGRIGPELEFGHVVGNHYEQQVLLIKTAWGGKSLFRDFRPPSAGLPADEVLQQDLERARRNKPAATLEEIRQSYGASYRQMLAEVRSTLGDLQGHFPEYADQGYELAGFVWFQGFNDMINPDYTAAYTENLVHFIRDVRRDLQSPHLPFVIGVLGVDGRDDRTDLPPNPKRAAFKRAQAAAGELPEFRGNVAVVPTDVYWDMDADAVFRKGWREHLDEWNQVGSDFPYHYLGSAKTYCAIGGALAREVIELIRRRDGDAEQSESSAADPLRFDPLVRNLEGWTVQVDPALVEGEHSDDGARALSMLANHLQRIKILVPEAALEKLQSVEIWIERRHRQLHAMQYHPSKQWLIEHGHDPRLARKVHITRASELLSREQMLKHPAVILHELAHAYHDQFLGFDHPEIVAAYEQAKEAGSYEQVLLYTGKTVRHYSLTNHKEYFAEGTEAYFYRNDFYPFVRAELKLHDPRLHDLLERLWGK
jgi:alpha-galactosidase